MQKLTQKLTARQFNALTAYKAGKKLDKGMMAALIRKGAIEGDMPAAAPATQDAGPYVIYNALTKAIYRVKAPGVGCTKLAKYATQRTARAQLTRLRRDAAERRLSGKRHDAEIGDLAILSLAEYEKLDTMVTRKNFMTGAEYQEDVNTPYYCSPSSETYWSM